MLIYNPQRRISAAEAYKHKWFENCKFKVVAAENMTKLIVNIKKFYVISTNKIG